jgi:putative hydrolase of the HAD superfamily
MAIKTIVFDFGNVVGFFDHRLTTDRLAVRSHLSPDAIHSLLFGGQLERDYDAGKITTNEFLQRAREMCVLTCPEEELAAAWADIFWPNHSVCALLPALRRHYRLLLASNTNELHARHFQVQFHDLLTSFHSLELSYEIGVCKPKAEFFAHCLERASCAPAECLLIDDLAVNVAAARACGWQGIVYTGFADLQTQLAALDVKGAP